MAACSASQHIVVDLPGLQLQVAADVIGQGLVELVQGARRGFLGGDAGVLGQLLDQPGYDRTVDRLAVPPDEDRAALHALPARIRPAGPAAARRADTAAAVRRRPAARARSRTFSTVTAGRSRSCRSVLASSLTSRYAQRVAHQAGGLQQAYVLAARDLRGRGGRPVQQMAARSPRCKKRSSPLAAGNMRVDGCCWRTRPAAFLRPMPPACPARSRRLPPQTPAAAPAPPRRI